jgi:hypothetical protein
MSVPLTERRSPTAPAPAQVRRLVTFAAIMMIIGGAWAGLMGIAAIRHDELFVTAPDDVYRLDLTTWGWLHLVLGALVVLSGAWVLKGARWARMVAIALAGLSMIANFLFLPYNLLWSALIITLDVVVIRALLSYREPR